MTEEAKQVLKPNTESLKDLALNSRIGWAKLSELEEKAEECETELKLQREELDKKDGRYDLRRVSGRRGRLRPPPRPP